MFCFSLLKFADVRIQLKSTITQFWSLSRLKNHVTTYRYFKHYILIIVQNKTNMIYYFVLIQSMYSLLPNQNCVFIFVINFSDFNVTLNDVASTIDTR